MSLLIYQIDFSAVAAGKRVSSTKRKIRWRFGFANQQAIENGRTGTDCRGEEHDVSIVWSITSGKRQISMDGKEVHYSTNRAGMLDFSWQSKGNHVIKVLCHAAAPMTPEPGFRQYDLSIDGQSFFTMPKVFQVGVKGSNAPNHLPGRAQYRSDQQQQQQYPTRAVGMGSRHISSGDIPGSQEQEEADLRRAIEASINESRNHLGEMPNGSGGGSVRDSYSNGNNYVPEMDLLGVGGSNAAVPPPDSRSVASGYSAPTTYGQNYQSPLPPTTSYAGAAPAGYNTGGALVPAVAPPGYYQAPPPQQQQQQQQQPPPYTSPPPPPPQQYGYGSPPPVPPAPASTPNAYYGAPPVHDPFGLHSNMANVNDDPFAPKPPPPPSQQDFASAILASYQTGPGTPLAPGTPGTPHTNGTTNGYGAGGAGVALNMNALAITTVQEPPKSEFEKALSNLVNVDHIDEPAEGEIKLTMIKKQEATRKLPNGKSIPKPPAGVGMVGSNAPISQIKQNFTSTQHQTSEGIMNAPPPGAFNPNAAASGMLVVHGQGPPPLQQMQGFGVGRMLPNGGMPQQQNLAPGYR